MHAGPVALIVRTAGTNCDAELARAFHAAGARPELVHIDRLIADPARLDHADLVGFPGGFSYGDDVASGRILAIKVRERLFEPLARAVARGAPVIGVCNGFQVLTQAGLLSGAESAHTPPTPTVALAENAGARFIDAWLRVEYPPGVCVWTRGLDALEGPAAMLPIAHGEGRLVADDDTLDDLEQTRRVAVRYLDNANGSMRAVAGLCDDTGLVLGLMPHPERFADWRQHPTWTRLGRARLAEPAPGLRLFRNAVEHVAAARV